MWCQHVLEWSQKVTRAYNRIPIWANLYRVGVLERFRRLVRDYDAQTSRRHRHPADLRDRETIDLIERISTMTVRVKDFMVAANVDTDATMLQPYQGIKQSIDAIDNVVAIAYYTESVEAIVHPVNAAIGVYQHDRWNALLRTVNPLYWFSRLVEAFAELPFLLLGQLGYDAEKTKATPVGRFVQRLFTAVGYLIGLVAGVIEILNAFGWWPDIKVWLQTTFGI